MTKKVILSAGLLIIAFLFLLAGGKAVSPGPGGIDAFKKEKLGLAEKEGNVYLSAPAKHVISPTGARELYLGEDSRYVLSIPGPIPEYRLRKALCLDIDRDGLSEYYFLRDGVLTVACGADTIWQSPGEWWVDDFFTGDADNNGITDLNLLVWKVGNYGSRRPFWVTGEDKSIRCHLFIFDLSKGAFKPVWQSSNLDRPNYGSVIDDINGDGKNELVVSEGDYAVPGERRATVWKWNGWGFSMLPIAQ